MKKAKGLVISLMVATLLVSSLGWVGSMLSNNAINTTVAMVTNGYEPDPGRH